MLAKKVFTISDKEIKKFENWIKEHDKSCRYAATKISRDEDPPMGWTRWTYKFNQNSIGCVINVQCECGEEVNITDYESW